MGHNNILKWFTIPPIIAVATLSLAGLMGSMEGGAREALPPALWALVGLLFLTLTALYGLFILHGFPGLLGLQGILQGMLLCLVSLGAGGRIFPWVGVILAVSGAAALVSAYNHHAEVGRAQAAITYPEGIESHIPIACMITDGTGNILMATDALLKTLKQPREEVVGQNITNFLTLGEDTVEVGGKVWDLGQEQIDDGHFFFQLKEKGLPVQAEEKPAAAPSTAASFTDPDTRLHSASYAMLRLEEELYRCRRYGHPLTAGLLRLAFPEEAEQDGSAGTAFNAYCGALRGGLRASDTAALSDARTILLVFPECPPAFGDTILQRLLMNVNAMGATHTALHDATALHVLVSFEGAGELPGARALLDRLNGDLAQKYSPN